MTGEWPTGVIDHIDGNSLNNRWNNLRDVTTDQNNSNKAWSEGREIIRFAGKYYLKEDGYPTLSEAEKELEARKCLF